MAENKQVQIIIRTTQEEKNIITQKAKDKGISVNELSLIHISEPTRRS